MCIRDRVRFFDLGYGSLAAVGGYGAFFLLDKLNFGLAVSLTFGVAVAGLVGFVIYQIVYRPLRVRQSGNLVMLVASLGTYTVIQSILAMLFSSRFQILAVGHGPQPVYHVFGAAITQVQVIILIATILVVFGLHFLQRHPKHRRKDYRPHR